MANDNYRVIEILDEFSIIINYGREHGASEDDEVRIISTGPEIIDPETKESLGTLDTIKSTLSIVTVYEKFSLCKNIIRITRNFLASPLSQFQTTSNTAKSLNVDEESISNKKRPTDKLIRVGDKVEIL